MLAGVGYEAIGYLCLGVTIASALLAVLFGRQLRLGGAAERYGGTLKGSLYILQETPSSLPIYEPVSEVSTHDFGRTQPDG